MRLRRLDAVDAAARESTRLVNVTLSRRCVDAMPRRLDAVDVAARESTRLARESRRFRDGVGSTQDDKLKFAFMMFDEDGSGMIERDELIDVCEVEDKLKSYLKRETKTNLRPTRQTKTKTKTETKTKTD